MSVAPLRGRGLKHFQGCRSIPGRSRRSLTGAWIETSMNRLCLYVVLVAPLRGRGLKLILYKYVLINHGSLPYGGVD